MSEAFGFESWLHETNDAKWKYEFELSTMHSFMENGTEQMHDLSNWLKRYIVDICKVEAVTKKQKTHYNKK